MSFLAHDGWFWRRLASAGARRAPRWWARYSPPFFGVAAAMALPSARHAVRRNLTRIRGPASAWRDTLDTAKTFATYAECLTEVLATGSKNAPKAHGDVFGAEHVEKVIARGKGVIILTMHTAGWESATPLLARDRSLDVLVVMEEERHEAAQAIHDRAREAAGVKVAHVGADPLSALPLMRHLEKKGAVAMQIDRAPRSGRTIKVELVGAPAEIPEGPFRIAQLSGAALAPTFSARLGFGYYVVQAYPAVLVERRATKADLAVAAQKVADAMSDFLRRYPTQWFHFADW
jgi:lauroyl/myristoyl acyltransferase